MLGKISGIYYNDTDAAPGFCVSVYISGCEFNCKGCHNPEAQCFDYGEPLNEELIQKIISALNSNGIMRKLCILGGEPFHPTNVPITNYLIKRCKEVFHNLEIYIWTGYTFEKLVEDNSKHVIDLLKLSDYLIDGPFIEELRDVTLKMRGSSNQRIIDLTEALKNDTI